MARRKKKPVEEEHENAERWLLTYADMITLLMVLFIVLFAIGQIDSKKFDKLHDGLAQSFGESTVLDGGAGLLDGSSVQAVAPDDSRAGAQALERQRQSVLAAQSLTDAAAKKQADAERQEAAAMAKIKASLVSALAKKGLTGAVQFEAVNQRGLVVDVITDRVLFDLGEATLRPEGGQVLDALAPVLKQVPNGLLIEGHTDNQPISDSRFASNWELSTQRATTVLRYLLTRGVDSSSVAAAGYADQRPLLAGDSTVSRARNRRVAIVILRPAATSTTSAAAAAATLPSTSGA